MLRLDIASKKIGFMLPSSCLAFEQEFLKLTKEIDDVIGIPARMLINATDANGLIDMNQGIELAAKQLSSTEPDVVIYMCTSGSFKDGEDGNQLIKTELARLVPNSNIMTSSEAIVRGIQTLGMKEITMTTPYNEDLTMREINFLFQHNIRVKSHYFADIEDNLDRGNAPPEDWLDYAKRLDYSGTDGFFLSCGNIQTLKIIDKLENYSSLPVVSSTQATIWMALRLAGVDTHIEGFGRLLREF